MNPHLLSQVAHDHVTDMRQSAAARSAGTVSKNTGSKSTVSKSAVSDSTGPDGTGPDGHRPTIRNRAGWTLVHIGLRLAAGSADA
jgi:hypothetical protein